MSNTTQKSSLLRPLEWLAALIGAVNCIILPGLFAQSGAADFPLPALYFVELALLGVLVLVFVAMRYRYELHWNALPWVVAGVVLAFVILGAFTIGPTLIPAFIAFVATGILIDLQSGGLTARHLGYLLLAAVVQGAIIMVAQLFL